MTRSGPRRRQACRAVAFVLLVIGWGMPLGFPHLAEDDPLCAVGEPAAADQGARLVESAASASDGHCEVCHSLRSFRHAGLPEALASIVAVSGRALILETGAHPDGFAPHRLPARAPPA